MSNSGSFVDQLRSTNQIDSETEKRFENGCRYFRNECTEIARQGGNSICTTVKEWTDFPGIDFATVTYWFTQENPDVEKKVDWLVSAFTNYLRSEKFTYTNVKKEVKTKYGTKRVYKKKGFWGALFDEGEEVTDYSTWRKEITIVLEAKW